ncbi:phosphoribosylaminoimidazole carboxylase, ATPase subunit [Gleimia coleocanis DSM 15436]|uniref:N5-carboxyaminoimidazole ribonucleotide synthase n=1 Tax=Gleimia coleocanis DSM 15436 TaxID=525245 RepID=C0VZR6_9ACTO|nr:5-(carboxyamino)imidazole ribonucleotide synthase [Gleimia coleocanis]EEH63775.1 phosphoribosylaminoimidazole carboxylase, ATPase subunit [Gleimia coleocanis DSM 15436]
MSRVVAVIGGGQLARMMAPPATNLNITLKALVEGPLTSASKAIPASFVARPGDLDAVKYLVEGADVLTFEHEHIPAEVLAEMEQTLPVYPKPQALLYAQDKLEMRAKLEEIGVPVPRWTKATMEAEVEAFGNAVGWPIIVKTPRGGYDGKGVKVTHTAAEVSDWLADSALILEEKVPFVRELSQLVARSATGEFKAWPLVASIQKDGVCWQVIAPAPQLASGVDTESQAAWIAQTIAEKLDVTGVLAVELFETADGKLYVNELAMRPHNSGHWTQDGCETSQFEQHLRAVLGLPLGETKLRPGVWVMQNLLGTNYREADEALPQVLQEIPEAKVHIYGKDVRPGRKLGHINVGAATVAEAQRKAARAAEILFG